MPETNAKRKVLVVDDEEGIRALLYEVLRRDERLEVVTAEDGEQGLQIALDQRPDLVLLDVVMPRRSGWDVCAALKADPTTRHAKVVIVTALGQEKDRQRAGESGADDFLMKPFDLGVLRSAVARHLSLTMPS